MDCCQYLDTLAATDREFNGLVRDVFQQSFGKETFPNKTFLQLEHKYLSAGSIKYNPSSRTPSKRTVVFRINLGISCEFTRQQHMELDIPCSKMQKDVEVE